MTRNELANWWRIRRGRPALHPSDREIRRMIDRWKKVGGPAVQAEIDRLTRQAQEFGLPLPLPPQAVVGGFVVTSQEWKHRSMPETAL